VFVYVIGDDVNSKIYVGKTIAKDLRLYFQKKLYDAEHPDKSRSKSYFYAAIRKYGREHFHIFPLFEGQTDEEICTHEILLIKALASQNPDIGYNICRGGEGHGSTPWNKGKTGAQNHSPETRKRISETMKSRIASGELPMPKTTFEKGYTHPHVVKGWTNSGSFVKGQATWNKGKGVKGTTNNGSFKVGQPPWNKGLKGVNGVSSTRFKMRKPN
jgi:hypothetical protein